MIPPKPRAQNPIDPILTDIPQDIREPKFNPITKFNGKKPELLAEFKADLKTQFHNQPHTFYNDLVKINFAINFIEDLAKI